jgi:Ca2+-binding EF-hand superfamily protein
MDEHVAAREALDQAFAQRRRNAAKEAGEAHRTAVQHRQDRRQRAQSREMDHSRVQDTPADLLPAADDFQKQIFEVLAEPATSSSASNPQDRCPSQASEDSGRKSDDLDEQEGNRRGSIFEFIAPKNCRAKRLSSLDSFCRQGRRLDRMQRLLTSKRLEFEQRPETERRQLSEAFQRHDKDASGSLDPKEITACLADLGFKPHTAVECREIRRIGYEVAVLGTMDFLQFVFEMVPRARAKLRELRRGPLLLEFGMFDQDESGHLDRQECMQVLEMICTANLDPCGLKEMEDQFMRTIEELSGDDGHVEFEIFQSLLVVLGSITKESLLVGYLTYAKANVWKPKMPGSTLMSLFCYIIPFRRSMWKRSEVLDGMASGCCSLSMASYRAAGSLKLLSSMSLARQSCLLMARWHLVNS